MSADMTPAAGHDESAAARMGVIEINDLVFKMESDLSVAINRTHKNNYFQQTSYDPTQTSICIFNSGADYIDPRRSFFSFQIELPATDVTGTSAADPNYLSYINCYFGANGSVLNLIDSVVVSTRSGDELSRVNDYAQLMVTYIPWTFGPDWARTVGQQLGLGSYLPGKNTNNYGSPSLRTTYHIPLYLLSPIFSYGRLLPSMLMSGMKIELRWKPLAVAAQQYWQGNTNFLFAPLANPPQMVTGFAYDGIATSTNMTQDRAYLYGSPTDSFARAVYGLDPLLTSTNLPLLTLTSASDGAEVLTIAAGASSWASTARFPNERGPPGTIYYSDRPPFMPGIDQIGFERFDTATGVFYELIYDVLAVLSPTNLLVMPNGVIPSVVPLLVRSMFRQVKQPFPNRQQRYFTAPLGRGFRGVNQQASGFTLNNPLTSYTINNPFFQLCSIQLTDAIQRHLNEYSATNGLEIVYADWDRTAQSLQGTTTTVYTEVRKSASRALMAFSVVTKPLSGSSYYEDSYRSEGYWTDYQYQLGSLYFPQQRVESKGSSAPASIQDNMYALTYNYALDAWDRYHPKAAPTMVSLRGSLMPLGGRFDLYETEQPYETRDDSWLVVQSPFGQTGSFANGAQCVAVTLERSTMFDLSGIPINNSRVLAIRGTFVLPPDVTTVTQYVFLKYVRLARVFLINCEVEQ